MDLTPELYEEICENVLDKVFKDDWGLKKVTPSKVTDQLSSCCYGQHDANWLSFFYFFRVFADAPEVQNHEGLEIVAQNCGWWWPFDDMAILTDRPLWIDLDEENRLHSTERMAIRWPDGSGFHMWHGTRIPDWIIETPDLITAEKILAEENVEIRRIMLEKVGFERLLTAAKKLHEDDFGVLYRLELTDDEPVVMVRVVNSTAEPDGSYHEFVLRVPPTVRTAREAVAWTYDIDKAADYRPLVET